LDEIYKGHRIAIGAVADGSWRAKISRVTGHPVPYSTTATAEEGEVACAARARAKIDAYLRFLDSDENGDI
jgi:hypothetical protein